LKNSVAATSSASATSLPGTKPAFSIATRMRSSAARFDSRFGAKPPSSPRPVDRPLLFSTDLREW
jgi:hypothetical protein